MSQTITLHRWIARVTYRRDDRDESVFMSFEELHELHDRIERGPNFYAIKEIHIAPSGRVNPMTIEQAERE